MIKVFYPFLHEPPLYTYIPVNWSSDKTVVTYCHDCRCPEPVQLEHSQISLKSFLRVLKCLPGYIGPLRKILHFT